MAKISVLFVCLGNICRSPTAHAVFQSMVDKQGLTEQIFVDSCGTGDWHIGRAPDPRSQQHALGRATKWIIFVHDWSTIATLINLIIS